MEADRMNFSKKDYETFIKMLENLASNKFCSDFDKKIINEQMEIKRSCKKSKSLEEINELKEELNGKSLSNSMHHEKETQAEFDAGVPDDVCELICGSCGTPNWIRDGDNYICNHCHLSLLE